MGLAAKVSPADQADVAAEEVGHFLQDHQPDSNVDAIMGLLDRTG